MTTATISVFMFLWRHKEKIAAVLVVLVLAWALKVDDDNKAADTNCGYTTSPAGAGIVVFGDYAYPTDKAATSITSPYGMRDGVAHRGTDIGGPDGAPIYAFGDGTVADAGPASGFGNWIVIDHTFDGQSYSTVYGHMWDSGVLVKTGERITAGQRIGLIGNNGESFGAHLHFEVWHGGRLTGGTDQDPMPWLQQADAGTPGRQAPAEEPGSPRPPPGDNADPSVLRARQIIDVGLKRNLPEPVIHSALSVGLIESNLRNLASDAVPDSKNYPNDGVAPGDHDSVGIFQQRRSTQSAGVDTKTAMDPVWQINTYYNIVEQQPNWETADPGVIAANVQAPRADLRGKYSDVMPQAVSLFTTYGASAAGAAGEGCTGASSTAGPVGPAGAIARKAVAIALAQKGKPYVWAAEGPDSFDCSGLMRYAYLQASGGSIDLPHYTGDSGNPGQLAVGHEVTSEDDLQPGDLILYNGSRTQASHVGMYVGDGQMVHAPTSGDVVKVGPISQGGTVVMMRRVDSGPATNGKPDTNAAPNTAGKEEDPS